MKNLDLFAQKIRNHIVDMTNRGGSSHVGSALSIVDILTVLYCKVMNYEANNPFSKNRDRFILSKGHAGAAVYATLAESGFFDKNLLKNHYKNGSKFSGHISHKDIPGVELSTGSLGHGLGVGLGMALSAQKRGEDHYVYVLLSDGEWDEGSNWESLLFAAHHKIRNLIAVIDYNKLQSIKSISQTLELEPFVDKLQSFGWDVFETDGHNHELLLKAFQKAKSSSLPSAVLCHTTKGKGVSFMENSVLWHYRSPKGDEYEKAKIELNKE
tara:strand:+ start:476 stop:1282 length:807 start_codon:yes stop_codon:yes gene_type:complete